MQPTSEIVLGIPPAQQRQAAAIYYDAFRQKISSMVGEDADTAVDNLIEAMHPENAFVAMREGQVLGLVGFQHGGRKLVDVRLGSLIRRYGLFSGLWRGLLDTIMARHPQRGEFLLDGIAVHTDARGQGVGTRLFDAVFAFAREQGYTHVRLDVVDTNPRARQLYERLGFVAVQTIRVPFLRSLGFTAVTTMRYDLDDR